ncbi:hypothetical protein J6Q66_04535 [bacterium]|nr:hypothetical protein [bacterium]
MDYNQFYKESLKYLEDVANKKGLSKSELEKYFNPKTGNNQNQVKGLKGVYKRMLFHAQNGTFKDTIIKFNNNYQLIKTITFNFDYKKVLKQYTVQSLYDKLITELSLTKSASTKSIPYKYANSIISCCKFLLKYNNLNELLKHFIKLEDMLPIYLSFELDEFGIPLACDFVKELDERFSFVKPDIHIRRIANDLGLVEGNVSSDKFAYKVIVKFKEIAKEIKVTEYKLDKILWLICTEDFYMHGTSKNNKDTKRNAYIKHIKTFIIKN